MKQEALNNTIRSYYHAPISDAEAQEASSNIVELFSLLIEIDREHGITRNHKGAQP